MAAAGYLPGFVEEYIRRDMGVRIERREPRVEISRNSSQ